MRILAIDTSAGTSVALVDEAGRVMGEFDSADIMRHAETIGHGIQQVLDSARLKPENVDAVAVGRGPAPFTGLRVGLAAALMFGVGRGVPVYGVVSHDAIALAELQGPLDAAAGAQVATNAGENQNLLVLTDARRKEVYWSLYRSASHGGQPERIAGPGVQNLAALQADLADQRVSYVEATAPCRASDLARVLLAQLAAGNASEDVTALYLRAPDAVPAKPKQVSS
jgi:tRNA threonylcarbamoyl adenosine modification protein YeaZ